MMSETQRAFVQNRDMLLMAKENQTARGLADDLVSLMELIAVHGETGIGADPDTREDYVEALQVRIIGTRHLKSVFKTAFTP